MTSSSADTCRAATVRAMTQPDLELPQPVRRVIAAAVAEERPTLEAFLDFYRDTVTRKVRGVSEEDARRRLVPSATTLGGIVKHLRLVELNWFERILAQIPDSALPPVSWDDPDAGFRMAAGETVDQLIADYDRQCERSRQIAARHELADTSPHREIGEVSLRWIYVHMIDETARHAGHADILREQIDGTTGS
ncbi:MAG: DinB family protein [Pseudonocardiaceae bacterium]